MSAQARRVLSVVPDLFFAARIAETARAAGVTLVAAGAGEAAALCAAGPPDLVILDLTAPGALEAARALKAAPATRHIPLLGFCPHVETALREAARAAGVEEVLPRSLFTKRLPDLLTGEPGPR
jgi:CheY-like chemotaxis protein